MPHTLTHSQTTEYRATQLVSSIKFKLSLAIKSNIGRDQAWVERKGRDRGFVFSAVGEELSSVRGGLRTGGGWKAMNI